MAPCFIIRVSQICVNYITFSTGLKKKKCCHVFTVVCKERDPINSDTGVVKPQVERKKK